MGNSKKSEGTSSKAKRRRIAQGNQEAYLQRTGRSVQQASAVVRRSNAVLRRGIVGAEDSRDRALQQLDASRFETAQTKASLESATRMVFDRQSQLSLEQDLRRETDDALAKSEADLREQQKCTHRQEVKRVAAEARSAELAERLSEMRQQGRELAKQNTTLLQEFGMTAGEWVPSRGGGTAEVSERSLQRDFMHERIKVSRLERKAKIMEPLLAKLRTKAASLQKQVSRALMPAILAAISKGYFVVKINTNVIHLPIHHTQLPAAGTYEYHRLFVSGIRLSKRLICIRIAFASAAVRYDIPDVRYCPFLFSL